MSPLWRADTGDDRGFVSVGVVLTIALLLVIATGTLAVARSASTEARRFRDVTVARFLAEGGIRAASPAGDHPSDLWSETPVHRVELTPAHRYSVVRRRLDGEFTLVESTGESGVDSARVRVAALAWRLSPAARVAVLGSALVGHGGQLVSGGSLETDRLAAPPRGWPASACASWSATVDSLFPVGTTIPASAPWAPPPWDSLPGLGPLGGTELLGHGQPVLGPTVQPLPAVAGGRCDLSAPDNWGSPNDPTGPCGEHRPVLSLVGPSTVSGGEGQGVLISAGDLVLEAGHRFVGIVLVGGALTVRGGAQIEGFARAGGDVHVDDASTISASACGALRGLIQLGSDAAPRWLPYRRWIEPA